MIFQSKQTKTPLTKGTQEVHFPSDLLKQFLSVGANSAAAKSLQLCPTLSDPMDCSPPGSSVYGIFQARVLEWGVIAFSMGRLVLLKLSGPQESSGDLVNPRS